MAMKIMGLVAYNVA